MATGGNIWQGFSCSVNGNKDVGKNEPTYCLKQKNEGCTTSTLKRMDRSTYLILVNMPGTCCNVTTDVLANASELQQERLRKSTPSVSEDVKQTAKTHYAVLTGIFGVLAAGLWVGIGFGIYFAGGKDPYYAGPIVSSIGVIACLLCSVRVYMNVMEVGQKQERDKEIATMIDLLTLAMAITLIACIPGIVTNVTMGLSYCFSSSRFRDDEDCQNEEENKNVSRGLLAGCAIAMIVCLGGMTFNQNKKKALGLIVSVRIGQATVTITQHQSGQGVNPFFNQMYAQAQQNPYQNNPGFNPYPTPQAPTGPMPPPPNYYETGGNTVYPPPQASYPSNYGGNQNMGFSNSGF